MRYLILLITLFLVACSNNTKPYTTQADTAASDAPPPNTVREVLDAPVEELTPVALSQALLAYQKRDQPVADLVERYKTLDAKTLGAALDTDAKRKAFWINTYNGFIQHVLAEQPELYDNRGEFFKAKQLAIAGQMLSFDDIEHGIIRHGRAKLSAGYLPDILDSDFEEMMATSAVDPRIHFAVNCGAKDCPQVHLLDDETLDAQLDALTKSFLEKTTTYDEAVNTVKVTPLMNWFRGDFGGKNSTNRFLRAYEIIPAGAKPKISYGDYDWSLNLDMYAPSV